MLQLFLNANLITFFRRLTGFEQALFIISIIFAVAIVGVTIFFVVRIIREKREDKKADIELIDKQLDERDKNDNA